jgi:ribosomal protein L29
MDFKDLQAKSDAELKELLTTLVSELHANNFAKRTKQIKQVHLFSQKRQAIARIKTLLHTRAASK